MKVNLVVVREKSSPKKSFARRIIRAAAHLPIIVLLHAVAAMPLSAKESELSEVSAATMNTDATMNMETMATAAMTTVGATASGGYNGEQSVAQSEWFSVWGNGKREAKSAPDRTNLFYLALPLLSEIYRAVAANPLFNSAAAPMPVTGGVGARFDFDGDGKADLAVYTPSTGMWKIQNSASGITEDIPWGLAGDKIVPADYDGDGKTDLAVWRPSTGLWAIINIYTGQKTYFYWGAATDIPVPADYDGDGRADIAVWRPADGIWYIQKSSDSNPSTNWYAFQFGGSAFGDIPLPGYYDYDSKADIAVYRPSDGYWYVYYSAFSQPNWIYWGAAGAVPVPADYNRDGKTDYAYWLPPGSGSSETGGGQWHVLFNNGGISEIGSETRGTAYYELGGNNPPEMLVPADYDGDGTTDVAAWNSTTGIWNIWSPPPASDGTMIFVNDDPPPQQLGNSCTIPVENAFIRQQAGACSNPPTPPSVTGVASPNSVAAGAATLLTATVTPGTNPVSTGITVTADLTSIGGAANQPFYDDGTHGDQTAGDNVFSFTAAVAASTAAGSKSFQITARDNYPRYAATSIALTVTAAQPTPTPTPTPGGTPQLSKEYIYGGSRTLAVEDATAP